MSLVLQDKLVLSPETAEHLQEEIDLLEAASDCADVVATHADLDNYDTSTLTDKAVIKVLRDEDYDNAQTYWRWSTSTETFSLEGQLGPYVNTVSNANKVYGTDNSGNQTTYDVNSFGQVDDVKVNNVSVVTNKIANIDLTGKVDKVTSASKVYGTDASGNQTTYDANSLGGGTWGSITGTLSNQTDLQTALNNKVSTTSSASKIYGTDNSGNQTTYDLSSMGGGGIWGSITGTLSDQTDLNNALDEKVSKITSGTKIYATSSGNQTSLSYSKTSLTNNYIPQRTTSGNIVVPTTPGADSHATSKKYVDDTIDTKINEAITKAVEFKGIVDDQTDLPSSGNINGDMYWIREFVSPVPTGMTEGKPGTAIYNGTTGLFEYSQDTENQPDGQTITYNSSAELAVRISEDEDNVLTVESDGLKVAGSDLGGTSITMRVWSEE